MTTEIEPGAARGLRVSQVAERLHMSRSRVHMLDAELLPTRCACGARIYSLRAVAAYEERRSATRTALSEERARGMRAMNADRWPRRRWRRSW